MTEEMKKKLDEIKYISMADFSRKIDEIKDMDDKLAFAAEYLLNHKDQVDYPFDAAINIARMKIADGLVEYDKMVEKAERVEMNKEAFPEDDIEDVDLKPYGKVVGNKNIDKFMSFPYMFLKEYGNKRIEEINGHKVNGVLPKNEKAKADRFDKNLRIMDEYTLYLTPKQKELNYLHINARLDAKFGSADALDKAVKATRPGVFSSIFNTTSMEGRNLLTAYKGFNDEKNPLYGQKDTLERAATAYVKHLFPGFEKDYPFPDQHLVNQLSGTQKTRFILCKAILESIRKENEMEDTYIDAVENKDGLEIDLNNSLDSDISKTNINNLDKDLDDSMSNDSIDNSESENVNNNIDMEL